MNDDLLTQYNRELSFIRRLAGLFADEHPGIAERLRLGPHGAEDPHVERLIQSFAFISGRIRQKLEDEFPEISESLLGILHPHYLNPIPSMGMVQLELASDQDAATGYRVEADRPIDTDEVDGEPCHFRTAYPVTLWPIEVRSVEWVRPAAFRDRGVPDADAESGPKRRPATVLKLVLRCRGSVNFQTLPLDTVRFFLKGEDRHVCLLYELIFNNTFAVALSAPADKKAVFLEPQECLGQVGFENDEGLLPYGPRSFVGYRLLTEFFAFPEKFLFVELTGNRLAAPAVPLSRRMPPGATDQLQVFFYLDQAAPDLEPHVSADTFRLGCTPVVNLYQKSASPIDLTHTEYQYRVVPDERAPLTHEVSTIDRVVASRDADGQEAEYSPFYSVKHAAGNPGQKFWHAARQPADPGASDRGTEVLLSLVDLNMRPSTAGGWTLHVDTTCINRDLPGKLPFGADRPNLRITEGAALVGKVVSLMPFTRTLRPTQRRGATWRLISHLTLNHLSLIDGNEHADALREILTLYDFADRAETQKLISGVKGIQGKRVVGRTPDGVVCRGIEVTLTLDESCFTANELFLFACVLERFFALYCTVNSFSRLVVKRVARGELKQWPPRVGEKVLI